MVALRLTRWRTLACAVAVLAGCNAVLGIEDVTVVDSIDAAAPPRDANVPEVVVDSAASVDAGADVTLDAAPDVTPPPQPNPACLIADKDDPKTTITFSDNPGSTTKPLGVEVRDQDRPLANVNIQLCTPASPTPIVNNSAAVLGGPPFRWAWDAGMLPRGVTQVTFRADPNATTVYETTRIEVR